MAQLIVNNLTQTSKMQVKGLPLMDVEEIDDWERFAR
jgi:hypothetical protein